MQKQNFNNHVRKHPVFHYFILPVSLLLIIAGGVNLYLAFNLASVIVFLSTILLHLIAFVARDYARKNQDRIIRTELRLRYFQLTGESFDKKERLLDPAQLAALRFAGDEELLQLLSKIQTFELKPVQIKQLIRHWQPDLMRV